MPSAPGYVRDLKQEAKTAKARGEVGGSNAPHAKRMRARRLTLRADPPVPILVDGVNLGDEPVALQVHHAALKLMAGPPPQQPPQQ